MELNYRLEIQNSNRNWDLVWEAKGQKLNQKKKREFALITYVKWDMKCNNELSLVYMQTKANWLYWLLNSENSERSKQYPKNPFMANLNNEKFYQGIWNGICSICGMQYADAYRRQIGIE